MFRLLIKIQLDFIKCWKKINIFEISQIRESSPTPRDPPSFQDRPLQEF